MRNGKRRPLLPGDISAELRQAAVEYYAAAGVPPAEFDTPLGATGKTIRDKLRPSKQDTRRAMAALEEDGVVERRTPNGTPLRDLPEKERQSTQVRLHFFLVPHPAHATRVRAEFQTRKMSLSDACVEAGGEVGAKRLPRPSISLMIRLFDLGAIPKTQKRDSSYLDALNETWHETRNFFRARLRQKLSGAGMHIDNPNTPLSSEGAAVRASGDLTRTVSSEPPVWDDTAAERGAACSACPPIDEMVHVSKEPRPAPTDPSATEGLQEVAAPVATSGLSQVEITDLPEVGAEGPQFVINVERSAETSAAETSAVSVPAPGAPAAAATPNPVLVALRKYGSTDQKGADLLISGVRRESPGATLEQIAEWVYAKGDQCRERFTSRMIINPVGFLIDTAGREFSVPAPRDPRELAGERQPRDMTAAERRRVETFSVMQGFDRIREQKNGKGAGHGDG